jgi:hypothetical protein
MSIFNHTFLQGLSLGEADVSEVRLVTPPVLSTSYSLTLPERLPVLDGDNVFSVTNSGVISNLNLGHHAQNAGRILKTPDGTSLAWTTLSTNPQIVGLTGPNASFSNNSNHVLIESGTYRLQISTSFDTSTALPVIAAVNAANIPVGDQPSSIIVSTTTNVNDTLVFTWIPDSTVTKLTLADFLDTRRGSGTSLFTKVSPVLATTISHIAMEHDTLPHTIFTASAENRMCFRFTRALDPTYALPLITTAVGTASSLRYEGACLHAAWTPSEIVNGTASLVVSAVKDVLGFVVSNVMVSSLTTVAALSLTSLRITDTSTSTKRSYAVLSQAHDVVAAFSRNIKRVATHSASVPTRAVFRTLTDYELTPSAASYTHSFTTGDIAGSIHHRILVVDAQYNLPYVFTPQTVVQTRLTANGFTQTVNKRGALYTAALGESVSMDFTRPIVAITSASASTGTLSLVNVDSAGDALCDYSTPTELSTDTLSFLGVKDDVLNDAEPSIQFLVKDLLPDPRFVSWIVKPNALDFSFGDNVKPRARFSTPLSTVTGITASSGSSPTDVAIVAGPDGKNTDVVFRWNTSASSSPVTLTFNGLVSAAGQADISPTENVVLTLLAPPTFSVWNDQAFEPSKKKTLRATFSKLLVTTLSMEVSPSTGSVDATSVLVDNANGQLVFQYTPPPTLLGISFTFRNLQAADGSRVASLLVPAGPAVTSFNATGASNTGALVLVGKLINYTFVFTKSLLSAPTFVVDGVSLTSVQASNTASVNILATDATRVISVNGVSGTDGSLSTSIPVSVVPVPSVNFLRLELSSNPGVGISSLFHKTTVSMIARFSGNLSIASAPSIIASAGEHPTAILGYSGQDGVHFVWTPGVVGALSLTFVVRDANGFLTTIQTPPYTVLATEPPRWLSTRTAKRTFSAPMIFDGDPTGHANYNVPVRVRFDKTLSSAPTAVLNGGGSVVGPAILSTSVVLNDTVEFSARSGLATTQIRLENIHALDGSSAADAVVPFSTNPTIAPALRTELLVNPGVPIGTAPTKQRQATRLRLVFPKPSAHDSGVGFSVASTISVSGGNGVVTDLAIESGVQLIFTYTPDTAGSSFVTFSLRRDNFGFEYPPVSTDPITIVE